MIRLRKDDTSVLIKSAAEIDTMRIPARELAQVLQRLQEMVAPGITTMDLEMEARRVIEAFGAKPSCLGYHGFPAACCISVNEEVVHGFPSDRVLKEGDIVSVDVCVLHHGFHADAAFTAPVGRVSPEKTRLMRVTREARDLAIEAAVVGNRIGDLSAIIQEHVEKNGFNVIRDYSGHGVGRSLHEDPQISNYGKAGTGVRIKAGMTLAIETMVNAGTYATRVLKNNWTVVTADGAPSAHFEHTVAVTPDGPEILTVV
ncbi:TPA: type I methionyl aminopeptidase [Candidatus Sumerlaeota bacterium]|jgi:methionyl aminopeptidase|nr:type I methionyl aminopeptidase [Candidatus Sumerlaeota bacterium]